jgi:16S rRNA pseudouridine516 synthase
MVGVGRMRLDKFLSMYVKESRRQLKAKIKAIGVQVNGNDIHDASVHINPVNDRILFEDNRLIYRDPLAIMLNKPMGFLSATRDDKRQTAIDLIGADLPRESLHIAGRLDLDAEGFLLLTPDGALVHAIISPKRHIDKTYVVTLDAPADKAERLLEGVTILDGRNKPYLARAKDIHRLDDVTYRLIIDEGKYHEVKRMFKALGSKVVRLKRTAIGGVTLDPSLSPGEYRVMSGEEIARITDGKIG